MFSALRKRPRTSTTNLHRSKLYSRRKLGPEALEDRTLLSIVPSFEGLGILTGQPGSKALGVSADGSTVVGGNHEGLVGDEAFRWTKQDGIQGLGLPSGATATRGYAASADGSVIVGRYTDADGNLLPFRWSAGAFAALGDLPGGEIGGGPGARDVSDDGNVVVGQSNSTEGPEAFVWTPTGGLKGLGDLPGGPVIDLGSRANGVSANGEFIVGSVSDPDFAAIAARWTVDSDGNVTDLTVLGVADAGTESHGRDISADGSVIVGNNFHSVSVPKGKRNNSTFEASEAFRWTEQTGMVLLGDLPGGDFRSEALSVSRDGSVIVGTSNSDLGFEAFVWDAAAGMRSLSQILGSVLPAGWALTEAWNVASDGTSVTIVGSGINPSAVNEGWIARLPAPDTDTPVAADDSYCIQKDNTLTVAAPGVLSNDTDPNGDALTSVLDVGPSNGTVTAFGGDGSFVYIPDAGFIGTDSFTYYATDGTNSSGVATVTIDVTDSGGGCKGGPKKCGSSSASTTLSGSVLVTSTASLEDPSATGDTGSQADDSAGGDASTRQRVDDSDPLPQPTQEQDDTGHADLVDLVFTEPSGLDDPLLDQVTLAV